MEASHRMKGLTRADVLIIVALGLFLLGLVPVIVQRMKSGTLRAVCKANLAAIGKAALVYANDHDGRLPQAGGRTSTWDPNPNHRWHRSDRREAFGIAPDGSGGAATVSSSLYLLVKYMGLEPRQFVCPGDFGTIEFKGPSPGPNERAGLKLSDVWDFGDESYKHCSYAYHLPYNLYALTTWSDPGMAVAADRNPWLNSPAGRVKEFAAFKPDIEPWKATPQEARKGNSLSHGQDGQNVLFLDGHVSLEDRAYCGLGRDNIYTPSRDVVGRGDALGILPASGSTCVPANSRDSLLVHDPALLYEDVTTLKAKSIDSKNVRQTVVVATLDCPLPEHENVIWCSTFQMAWDKFKQDIVGEPIQVAGAEELADRLNRARFRAGSIEEKSYYATAGFVNKGIIEQIQKEMARRFPAEPAPVFDQRYKTLEDVAVAYAYLNVDVGFAYPYYSYDGAFSFKDSNGTRAKVSAFCAQNTVKAANHEQIREQVEVLYDNQADNPETMEFAVDLCRHTKPYQVVLARIPRYSTLGEAARTLQDKIEAFKNDPNYKTLRTLRAGDTLIVPDVLYKLTHHFDELLGKHLANQKWQEYFFFEAMQKIDFTLSRTGVVLKSEARLPTTKSASPIKPRHLQFDRPFLIYVKMRDADAPAFFVMWVDNAELMKRY